MLICTVRVQTYSAVGLQVCKSASLQVCRFASLQVCKSASLQVFDFQRVIDFLLFWAFLGYDFVLAENACLPYGALVYRSRRY